MANKINSEVSPEYKTDNKTANKTKADDKIIQKALNIIASRISKKGEFLQNPKSVTDFLKLKLSGLEHEVFSVIYLDNQHRVIEYEELFRGTINGASVHPREVLKECLKRNASAVIFAHNHPSGLPEPSSADRHITKTLVEALSIIDITVLDHIIVGGDDTIAFSERGFI